MQTEKIINLLQKYYSLTPLGMALIGTGLIEQIDQLCQNQNERAAVAALMELYER